MNTEINLEVQLWNNHGFFDTLCSRVLQKKDGFMCDLTEFDAIVSNMRSLYFRSLLRIGLLLLGPIKVFRSLLGKCAAGRGSRDVTGSIFKTLIV